MGQPDPGRVPLRRQPGLGSSAPSWGAAPKPAWASQSSTAGTRRVLVLFARFKGEDTALPPWADDIFSPDLPGSFSHFYDIMSFGKLEIRGEVAPRVYESAQPTSAYLSDDPSAPGKFGQFSQEILRQADRDIDFAQFDNDGPDGISSSGDDDGVVDAVFLVLDHIPPGFLRSEATGISDLGFVDPLMSADAGTDGRVVQILPGQGTLQQGRFFAEAVGAMCHEYGHVLGLPDLYNTNFFAQAEAGPEEDSAGVGAWCLMGWGASGWNGNDGPNSFCAWSRLQLGWASPTQIANTREVMQLSEVGMRGEVYRVPVGDHEDLLLEYRTWTGCYYDRKMPGEGVLIWHHSLDRLELVCADGRWQDAGYPLGRVAEGRGGGDNLDFWAHDQGYCQAHAGNLGDGTDPFDGVLFRAFTPDTNPSSALPGRGSPVRLTELRLEAGLALAQVQVAPPRLEVAEVRLVDEDDNGLFTPGEVVEVLLRVANHGGLKTGALRAVLSTQDSLVQILRSEVRFDPLEPGVYSGPSLDRSGFPRLRLDPRIEGRHRVRLSVELFADTLLAARRQIEFDATSSVPWAGRIEDEAGQGMADINIAISAADNSGAFYSDHTDREGHFRFDLPPSLYRVTLTSVPHRPVPQQTFLLELADSTYSILVLPTAFPVSGVVRDLQGQPLSAFLSATQEDGPNLGFTNSAADGAYTLMLARGVYNLIVTPPPPLPRYLVERARVDGPQILDIDLANAATAVAEDSAVKPARFSLDPNYPNPFNPTTAIRFSLPQPGEAELSIYNLLGQRVAILVHGVQEAGPQVLQWNGRDAAGHELASGVYFYCLQAGAQVETRKLLLLR
ncbi:MAG: T9SS type A sorting domain-containing protein [Candidatus Latescibacteria bacterium]|nr:T9SS type A sorting domain-containing protein [Candidatus Latescibacterota bacterium]